MLNIVKDIFAYEFAFKEFKEDGDVNLTFLNGFW